LILQKKF